MPAPAIVLTRGPVTFTMTPIELRGFRINGSISQSAMGADWRLLVSTQVVDRDLIDDNDESASTSVSMTVPFNEADSEALATARLQTLVDQVYATIPTPAP